MSARLAQKPPIDAAREGSMLAAVRERLSARQMAVVRSTAPFALIFLLAAWSRLRYAVWSYHDTYGSGDAHLILAKAMFINRGEWRPPVDLGPPAVLFGDPPLIPFLLAGFSRVSGIPLAIAPLVLTSALTIVALFALFAILRRAFDLPVALLSVCLVALLPRFSLDSTEPDKAAYVVSFFLIALFFLYEGQQRPRLYLAAGFFMGLSVFSHNTGYLFLPVYGLSHIALSRGSVRAMFNRYFLASLAMPLLFIGAYLVLSDAFDRSAVAPQQIEIAAGTVPSTEPAVPPPPIVVHRHRFVPGSIQLYYDNVTGLAKRGFRGSAWNLYFDAIRTQISSPVYILAIAGFVAASFAVLLRRRFEVVPLLLWMLLVTLAFAIQHPALSHTSRYPSYVTPVFVIFAVFAVVSAARLLVSRAGSEMRPWYALAVLAPAIAFVGFDYATAANPGARELYASHRQLADYAIGHGTIGEDSQLLYIGWPSTTFYLLRDHPELEPDLHAFGWGNVPLERFTPAYVGDHHIKYYAYDHTGSDYFGSADTVLAQLRKDFTLTRVQTFCGPGVTRPNDPAACGRAYVTLFGLAPK